MSRKKRKQNFIDKNVQGSLLRRIVLHWFVFFFVAGISVVVMQALLGDPANSLTDRIAAETGEFVFLGVVLLAIFPAFLLDTIRFSNRFVGPISRLRRQLRELGTEGNTSELNFRDNDFWSEMASEFNSVKELVESQRAEIADLKTQLAQQESHA